MNMIIFNTKELFILLCLIITIFDAALATKKQNRRRLRRPIILSNSNRDQEIASSNKLNIQINPNRRNSDESQYKVVCYYTNWSQYRPKIGRFTPEDISPDLCTHIIFAFAWMKKGKITSFESNDETKNGTIGLYERIMKLKKANPKLKILMAIGGWSFGTQKFKEMSSTRFGRQTFIHSAIPFLRDRSFDGLDLDWEYPKGSEDKKNFVLLVKELFEAFDAESQETKKPRLLLTAAVPVGPDNIRSGYDVPAVSKYLDFINVMAYDFHGKWERETGHNAPLYAPSSDSQWRKQLSVSHASNLWHQLGAPKEKLIIGMPTYGRSFSLSNLDKTKVNSPASGGGKAGEYTKESGFLAYYEICEILYNGATYVFDDEMKVPYAFRDDQWVGFDDEKSIRNKMQWLKTKGYGGAMIWTLDMDDFNGSACKSVRYPLISIISEELLGISRGNVQDFDWNKVAGSVNEVIERKIDPEPISVDEILSKNKIKKHIVKMNNLQQNIDDSNERPGQILCYVTSWSRKRSGIGKFKVEDIDSHLCTHLIYAFATIKNNQLTEADESDLEIYEKLIALKEKNSNLKILLAIGGWNFGSKPFQELTSNVFRMNKFIYDAIDFLRTHKFDGLEVDWSYPRSSDEKINHVNFLKEIRIAFEGEAKQSMQPILILSSSIPASLETIKSGYDLPEISKYLDFINLMTYDYHGQWENQVGHNSPLYPLEGSTDNQKKLTVDYTAKEVINQGVPKEKLMIGIATYGRTFTLSNSELFDIGSSAISGGKSGKYTNEPGFLSFYEICDFLRTENTTLVWDNEQQVPFAYNGDQWVGFDDERSIKNKMKWLKNNNYGGVMIWTIDMDDSKNYCGGGKYPLLNKVNEELRGYHVKLVYNGPYNTFGGFFNRKLINLKQNVDELVCAEENGHISYHPDKNDCKMYYMCEGERKHHMPCPSNLVFNPNENVCDWPENVENCMHLTAAPPISR